ncbi:MAG: tRNA (cytidine(34)-2'-O)-methyltransferase [Deltaproteobacteria bacterium]|nr:tRNA (cytidine(34)-2'-O)-methyltransferase [Deltaproteobacteria bacterium]
MRDITKLKHKTIENPSLNIVLYQPEIPANTGNISRLCGAGEIRLHLIHPLGFHVDDKHLKRAGLDYWSEVDVKHHESFSVFLKTEGVNDDMLVAFSKYATENYTRARVGQGSYLLFGNESSGLPGEIRQSFKCYRIPIWGKVRSLNLSTAVGIVAYHYLHQLGLFK